MYSEVRYISCRMYVCMYLCLGVWLNTDALLQYPFQRDKTKHIKLDLTPSRTLLYK